MEETGNFFFAESAHIDSKIPKDKLKIGEIFRNKDGTTTLNCIHCSQEFHFFTEFTLHIQEHYLRNEILLQLDNIKCEDEAKFIDNNSMSITETSVKCEQSIDVDDGYYNDNDNVDKISFNNSYSNEIRKTEPMFEDDLISENQNNIRENDKDIKIVIDSENSSVYYDPMKDDNDNKNVFEEVEQMESENASQMENEPILNKHYKEVDGKFQCLLCLKSVSQYRILKDHYLAHIGTKNVFCPLCSKRFITVGYAQTHCYYTHKQSISREIIRKAKPKNVPNILIPPKKDDLILDKHYKKVDGRFQCLLCFKSVSKLRILKDHYLAHIGKKNVFCPLCLKAFISVQYVQKHYKDIHEQSISREMIRKAQTNMEDLNTKSDMENENSDETGTQNTLNRLDELLKTVHNKQYEKDGSKFGADNLSKQLNCLFCSKQFKAPLNVQRHIRFVHSKNLALEKIVAAQQNPELQLENFVVYNYYQKDKNAIKNFECFLCHRRLNTMNGLLQHMNVHADKKFGCPLCSRPFSYSRYVKSHLIITHSLSKDEITKEMITKKIADLPKPDRPKPEIFECILCKLNYKTRMSLRQHMNTHKLTLLCPVCGSVFKTPKSFSTHMQIHEAGTSRNIKCEHCDKMFRTRHNMQSHRSKVHSKKKRIEPKYKCNECGKMFARAYYMNQHVQQHNTVSIEKSKYLLKL